jgi:hypothetical protein
MDNFTTEELMTLHQWFTHIQDTNSNFLELKDYVLYGKIVALREFKRTKNKNSALTVPGPTR